MNKSSISRKLYGCCVGLIVLALLNGFLAYRNVSALVSEARAIRVAGGLNAEIQRIVKLESAGIHTDRMIVEVNEGLDLLETFDYEAPAHSSWARVRPNINLLRARWGSTRREIREFRASPTEANRRELIEAGEACWTLASDVRGMVDGLNQRESEYMNQLYMLIGADIALVLLIFLLVNRFVQNRLEVQAREDQLTQLLNRRAYSAALEEEVDRAKRYGRPLSLIVFDIDHFKRVNDTHGHAVGDRVLTELAEVASGCVRRTDLLCRIGGEEFVVIAPETDLREAKVLAERLRTHTEEHDFAKVGVVTISLGVATLEPNEKADGLFRRSDSALYRAKKRGRNIVCADVPARLVPVNEAHVMASDD